jgi:hypothetical protein
MLVIFGSRLPQSKQVAKPAGFTAPQSEQYMGLMMVPQRMQ